MSNVVKHGDTHQITFTVKDSTGAAKNLTGASVRILASLVGTTDPPVELASSVPSPTSGQVLHTLTGTLAAGTYNVEVEATIAGVIATAPTEGYGQLIVRPDLG